MHLNHTPLTKKLLTNTYWRFLRLGEGVVTEMLRFLSDGHVSGYYHPNESRWDIVDGCLCFCRDDGLVTTIFNRQIDHDGEIALEGAYISDPGIVYRIIRHHEWVEHPESTRFKLASDIDRYGWKIGDHTYGVPFVFEPEYANLVIGKFTSIANGVIISLGNHDFRNVSSYPFATLKAYWPSILPDASDHYSAGDVKIGNDVWIGTNVFIGSGVQIGDGAVIGAHSVVTKNVAPYMIVAGNPARPIRSRFEPDVVKELLSIHWWDWPNEKIDAHLSMITSHNVMEFIDHVRMM